MTDTNFHYLPRATAVAAVALGLGLGLGLARVAGAQPGAVQPDTAQPGQLQQPGSPPPPPIAAQPGVTQPGVTQPDVAPPGVAQPGVAQPSVAQPGVTQPGVTQPGVAQPGVAQPGVAQPGVAQPGAAQPDVAPPGVAQPGVAQPSVAQPGAAAQASSEPNPVSGQPSLAARRLSLSEAIQVAVTQGPEITSAIAGVNAAHSRVRSAGAQRFPKLHADGNLQYWNKPLEVAFISSDVMLPDAFAGLADQKLRVRDQLTWQFSATISQPLTGLIAIARLMDMEESGVNAARSDQQRALLDTAQRAGEAYLRLLQAKALLDVNEQSVKQVEAQLERAQILESGGVMQRVDVLRLQAARDNARHTALRATTAATTASEALVLALNLPTGTKLEVVDDLPDPPPALKWTPQDALAEARQTRPEIATARERIEQANAGADVARAQLFPNISAMGTYQHTEGQSTFQPKNAFYIGASLSWDLWEWGKTVESIKEANFKTEQARIGESMLHDQIAFDVRRRIAEMTTTYASLDVARSALDAAEEAYRIQSVSYREGGATTTDVIETETEVSRARSNYAQARYEYYLAQAGLARAVGQIPTARLDSLGGKHAVR